LRFAYTSGRLNAAQEARSRSFFEARC